MRHVEATIVLGDGSDPRVLEDAGARRADVVLALTKHDADNLVTCQVAQRMFGVPRVIALVNDPDNEAVFVLAGKADEGIRYAQEAIAILHDLGMPMWIAVEQCSSSCDPFLHSGRYTEAHQLLTEGLAIARQQEVKWPIGAGLLRLAKLAMAEGDFAQAAETLKESIALLQSIDRLDELGDAHIALATCLVPIRKVGKKGDKSFAAQTLM